MTLFLSDTEEERLKFHEKFSKREKYMSKLKKIPKFKSEDEEAEFWSKHDSTEYVDYSKAKSVTFVHLKPSLKLFRSVYRHLFLNILNCLPTKEISRISPF
jgi:hypothetical protein